MIKKGQRFRAKHDIRLHGIIAFNAPYSDGFEGTLRKGDVLTVENDPPKRATGVYAKPDRYAEIEAEHVPERVRRNPDYSDYAFAVSFKMLENDFESIA